MKNNKYILGIFVTFIISNSFASEDKEKEHQSNTTNLLAITTGITICGIQSLIANYAEEFTLDKTLNGHDNSIKSLTISPDNKYIASGDFFGTLKIWNFTTGNCEDSFKDSYEFDLPTSIRIKFTHDGKNLAVVHNNRTIKIWDTKTRQCIQTIKEEEENTITSFTYSPCSKYIAYIINEKPGVKIFDIKANKNLKNLTGHINYIQVFAYSPCGNFIATCSRVDGIKIWDTRTNECINTLKDGYPPYSLAFSHNSKTIAVGTNLNRWSTLSGWKELSYVKIWDLDTESKTYSKCIVQSNDFQHALTSLESSKYRNYLLSFGNTVQIWQPNDNYLININDKDSEKINHAIYSSNGLYIITVGDNITIKIFKNSVVDLLGLKI